MMMIRSQDRKTLMPIEMLSIGWPDQSIIMHGQEGKTPIFNSNVLFGLYESEARCLEVLDEIQKMASQYLNVVNGLGVTNFAFNYPKVYQMPEK